MKIDDQTARQLQDAGVDLEALDGWEQSDEGKAALARFAEMCERGEIIHRSALDPMPPIRFEDIATEEL